MADYTNSWTILDPKMRVQGIAVVSTVQNHPLGTRVKARDDGTGNFGEAEFIYLPGVASCAVGSWVTYYPDNWATLRLAANAIAPVAVAMAAVNATTSYGWFQVFGKAVGLALAGYADNGLVYATATAGSVDDAAVAGDRVKCALGASAIDHPDTGFAEFEIAYPYMDDGSAA
jgi:hypothetical protein